MATEPIHDEIDRSPLWPGAPRYYPTGVLPAYRFRPGYDPHPVRHPDGYSYGEDVPTVYHPPEDWRDNGDYLFAIDLYHLGYFWRAHEYWEGLWRAAGRDSPDGRLYRGLIQLAGAELKRAVANPRGAATLSRRARTNLAGLPAQYMGLDLERVRASLDGRFGPLWHSPPQKPGEVPVYLQLTPTHPPGADE